MRRNHTVRTLIFFIALMSVPLYGQGRKPMTLEDVMRFRAINDPVLSADGKWIAYSADPDRGDGAAYVQSTEGRPIYPLELGSKPTFSKDSRRVAITVKPAFLEVEKAKASKSKDGEPRQGLAILTVSTGEWKKVEKVEKYAFSDDSGWIAILHYPEKTDKPADAKAGAAPPAAGLLELVKLDGSRTLEIPSVTAFAFSPDSRVLAYGARRQESSVAGVFFRDLQADPATEGTIMQAEGGRYSGLAWSKKGGNLAFLSAPKSDLEEGSAPAQLNLWNGDSKVLKTAAGPGAAAWFVPLKNDIRWTGDGVRIFFGRKPEKAGDAKAEAAAVTEEPPAVYDIDAILKKREGDVWHWNDPRIVTQQKILWPRVKDQTWRAVYHLDSGKVVPLADESLPDVGSAENPLYALGTSDLPYLKEITWDGNYSDVYLVGLKDGSRKKIVSRLSGRPSLSPQGRFVAYFQARNWHLYDSATGATRNLTASLGVPFADEDDDRPDEPGGYGVAGWTENDEAVLIYDKFDIWSFPTASGPAGSLTAGQGRRDACIYRMINLDPDKESWKNGEAVLLSTYSDRDKNFGYASCRIGGRGVETILEQNKRFRFLQKASASDVVLFTRESYEEFPDLWVADARLQGRRKLTDVNPQMNEFAWGSAELVAWNSVDGVPLQGVLIKPGNYEPGKRYPVIVYFYELSSQRLYEFNQPVVNHRPCFPFYTSNGYALFLPDVRFEVGRPGLSATKCVVPGVQKLVDMGVADPKGLGLHGHSWGGYGTAFMVTQTNMFAAAIAGAPVGNMTSAYSGIRWESGLARQMQYETGQSRIGKSLWEAPQLYIENSPVFFADRIQTPLLIEHGDADGAVPWYQGIELYLAMRRLGKNGILLEYNGEPHHLQKYPNKLDYAIKMKEYFDHYLKGLPAASWITEGVPYRGK